MNVTYLILNGQIINKNYVRVNMKMRSNMRG